MTYSYPMQWVLANSPKCKRSCFLSSLLLYRRNGDIGLPLPPPTQQGHQDGPCLYGASNLIEPRSMDAVKKNESNVSLRLWVPEGNATGERREGMARSGWRGWPTFLLHVPCSWNSYPAVLTNSAASPKPTINQMSNYKWVKAGQKQLQMESFGLYPLTVGV